MAYVGKTPKFDSTILKDESTNSVSNPAASSHKIVNRSGKLVTKSSSGAESTQKARPEANIAAIKAIGTTERQNGDIAIDVSTYNLYCFQSASSATNDDDFVLQPSAGSGRWIKFGKSALKTAQFDDLSPTTTKGDIIANDGTNNVRQAIGADGLILKADSTTSTGLAWGSAAAGTGEVNYIENPDAEANTTGWATYADAAGTTPVDGTGGSPNITWTRQSGTVLRGNQSFKLTKDAANRQGEGVSYDFSIKGQDTSKKLKIQFDFKTDEDAAYAAGDLAVYIYDVTNSTLITPVDTDIISGQNIFQTSFNSTTSTSYRLIFHVATTNASAWDAYIDNVIVGPGMTSQGAAIGKWISYTPTDSGLDIAGGSSNLMYRRVGDSLEIIGDITTGTTSATEARLGLPSGLTIGGDATSTVRYGKTDRDASVADSVTVIRGVAGETYFTFHSDSVGTFSTNVIEAAGQNGSNRFGSSERVGIQILSVPIAEWAGKGIVPMLAEDNLSEWTAYPGTLNGFGSATNDLEYRRVGDTLEIQGSITAGTVSAPQSIDLPSGLTAAAPTSSDIIVGTFDRSVAHQKRNLLAANGDTSIAFGGYDGSGVNPLTPDTANNICNSSERVSVKARIQIQEWAGSQNSLVGYSEATSDNLGLVKKNKWQVKELSADLNGTGINTTISSLGFNSLTIGKVYQYTANLRVINTSASNQSGTFNLTHDSSTISQYKYETASGSDALNGVQTISVNRIFTATATSVSLVGSGFATGARLDTNTGDHRSFAQIIERNDLEPETTDFT